MTAPQVTELDDGTRAALHVPDGTPSQLLPWLRGDVRPPARFRADGPGARSPQQAVVFRRLTSFWQGDGFNRLADATRVVLEGAGRMGWDLQIRVAMDDGALRYAIAGSGSARALATAVHAAFDGAEVEEFTRAGAVRAAMTSPWAARARCALVGVPVNTTRTSRTTLLERLVRSGTPDWSLLVRTRLAPSDLVRARCADLGRLRAAAENASRRTVQVTGTTTQSELDPVAEVVASLLAKEEDRTVRAMRTLALVCETWIEAPDESVEGLAAIAAASLGGDHATVFPVRVMREAATGSHPAILLLPGELSLVVQPPASDVRGLPVTRWLPMDSEPEPVQKGGPLVRLATSVTGAHLDYPADALCAHALISGTTGSGKSSFLKALLHEVSRNVPGVTFLVIEPTKDEYRHLDVPGLRTWQLGAPGAGWHLNPLEVPAGVGLSTHVDLLLALFSSTFALFPPLPYVLEMALRRAYEDAGWDFRLGRHRSGGEGLFPTLGDLERTALAVVDELGYSGEVLHNVSAALRARLGSLVHGVKGEVLETDAVFDIRSLLGRPTVVNLDLVGNDREKAFLMGLVLLRLWEARRAEPSRSLVHLTVVEEAHRILRDPRPSADGAGGEGGFAAETFGNLLAEVRAAGEGLIIVDQSPRKLVRDVLTNTSLKVACRTLGPDDRQLLSQALNIEDAAAALTALPNHEALVFWEGMDRPVRARLAIRLTGGAAGTRRHQASTPSPSVPRDAEASRLADTLLRVRAPERDRLWHRLLARLDPPVGGDPSIEVARLLVEQAASRLARQRGWPREARDRMVAIVLPRAATPGTTPEVAEPDWRDESTCSCVGGPGREGCRVAEPMRDVARRFRRRHPGFDPTTVADAELFDILRPYVLEELGTGDLRTSLDRSAMVCLASQIAGQVRPLPVASAFRDRLRRSIVGREEGTPA